jgi:outer membrane protein
MGMLRRFGFLVCFSAALNLHAEDLKQVYDIAVVSDPTVQAAYAAMQANKQQLPEAIAAMVPNLSANYSASAVKAGTVTASPLVFAGGYNSKEYTLTLAQPIYHPEQWAQVEQSRHVAKGAIATYYSASQELILRVAKQYFAILGAIDDLDFAKGQRKAFSREYEQAKQRFDVGLIAITDVETSKAKYDNAVAEEISAQNAVANQYEKLREITGVPILQVSLFPICNKISLVPPTPNEQETWVNTANIQNLDIIAAKETAQQFKAAIGAQAAGHFPKVDVQGNLQRNKQAPPFGDMTYNRSVTLNISVPIFSGGGTLFRTKEAQERYEESMKKLETTQRLTDSTTRQSFRGVLTAISSVEALAQAVISNQSALKATKAAYEVGTRTIVDVLNAESQLLNAQREHSKARYNYLLQGLQLKRAAGTLTASDLYAVNYLITKSNCVDVKEYNTDKKVDAKVLINPDLPSNTPYESSTTTIQPEPYINISPKSDSTTVTNPSTNSQTTVTTTTDPVTNTETRTETTKRTNPVTGVDSETKVETKTPK